MTEPTSYRNEAGNLVFAYSPETSGFTCWYVGERRRVKDGSYAVAKIQGEGLRTWRTEEETRAELHDFAKRKGYEPAY